MISGDTTVGADARAGFWIRFGASFIDGLIVGAVTGVLEALLKTTGEVIGIVFGVAYFVYFEGGPRGAGPGKRALGIRVVDLETGHPIGYPRAFVRYVGRIVSTIVFFLGYFWMLWDPQRQCWHDKFAHDVVVPEDAVY
jgi:uncharacterized RDD family membrane protein YckC